MKKQKNENGFAETVKVDPIQIPTSYKMKSGLMSKPLEDALDAVERMGNFTKH